MKIVVKILKPGLLIVVFKVLALVGFRKAMDFFPRIFSQKELFWLGKSNM